jgi:hypothetical protein
MQYKEDMPDEMLRLARSLRSQTQQGQIHWQTTDRDNQFLFSSTRSGALIIKEGANYYTLQLLNSVGSVISTLQSTGPFDESVRNQLLEELYYSARSDALDIENSLQDMFGTLGIEPGPSPE